MTKLHTVAKGLHVRCFHGLALLRKNMERLTLSVSIATAALAGVLYVYENLVYLHVLHSLPPGLGAVAALQTESLRFHMS